MRPPACKILYFSCSSHGLWSLLKANTLFPASLWDINRRSDNLWETYLDQLTLKELLSSLQHWPHSTSLRWWSPQWHKSHCDPLFESDHFHLFSSRDPQSISFLRSWSLSWWLLSGHQGSMALWPHKSAGCPWGSRHTDCHHDHRRCQRMSRWAKVRSLLSSGPMNNKQSIISNRLVNTYLILAWFRLWNVQDNRHSIFVVIANQTLVGVSSVASYNTISSNRRFTWFISQVRWQKNLASWLEGIIGILSKRTWLLVCLAILSDTIIRCVVLARARLRPWLLVVIAANGRWWWKSVRVLLSMGRHNLLLRILFLTGVWFIGNRICSELSGRWRDTTLEDGRLLRRQVPRRLTIRPIDKHRTTFINLWLARSVIVYCTCLLLIRCWELLQ